MPLVTSKEMFEKAYQGGYAIGAFNVNNMEIVQGITEAAKDLNAPLILQVSKGARAYANHTYLIHLVQAAVEETGLPIVLHLDHGDSYELCKSCIDGGFTSVMIDASSKPFAENIEITKQVVAYAHDHGVVVEAELVLRPWTSPPRSSAAWMRAASNSPSCPGSASGPMPTAPTKRPARKKRPARTTRAPKTKRSRKDEVEEKQQRNRRISCPSQPDRRISPCPP